MQFEAIDNFLARVKQMTRTGSKDMRLSMQEANVVAVELAELLAALHQRGGGSSAAPEVIDGGSFKDRNG